MRHIQSRPSLALPHPHLTNSITIKPMDRPRRRRPAKLACPEFSSNIQNLQLEDICVESPSTLARILSSCKALSSCQICLRDDQSLGKPAKYWAKILTALGHHSDTLRKLSIRSYRTFMSGISSAVEIPRLKGFRKLHRLEVLEVPWRMLMGKPGASADYEAMETCIPRDDWKGHAMMCNVVPPSLRSLRCYIRAWREPESFYDSTFMSVLPTRPQESGGLRSFTVVYDR